MKQPQSNKRKQIKKDKDRQLQAELEQFEQKVMEQEQDDEQSKETDVNQPVILYNFEFILFIDNILFITYIFFSFFM